MADRRRYSALTEDSYDDYSDDFQSDIDDEPTPVKSAPEKSRRSPPTRGRTRLQARGRGRGRGQGGRHSQARSDTQFDVVTKRILSANRLKMNELRNELEDMRKQMKVVVDENKLYKRMQHKQEKALVKFEDRESELPQLIQAHSNEVRSLKEQLRKIKSKYEKTDRYLRDAEDELEANKARLKKYKALTEQKELAERSELDRKLNKAELDVEEKESKIAELSRHLEMLKKNHRHELGIERARSKDTQRQLDEAKDKNTKLEAMVKEKDKLLEAKNIYSHRMLKPASYNGTPAESPAPWRQAIKNKSGSLTDLTSRDKARAYEEKRKEEKKKLRLPKLQSSQRRPMERPPVPRRSQENKQKWEVEDREKETNDSLDTTDKGHNFAFSSLPREDSGDGDFWRRQEERFRRDQDNRQKQEQEQRRRAEEDEREQARFQQDRDRVRRELEDRERAERERREADDRERQARERREREERERQEERARKDKEDRERREEEERRDQERRAREEREAKAKLDNDPTLAEERRKKDELLRKLKEMDSNRTTGAPPSADPFAPSDSTRARGGGGGGDIQSDPFSSSPSRKANKDPFALSRTDSSDSTPSSKKDYNFTRSVENMHKGKPAREDVSVPYIDRQKKIKAAQDDAEVGGYQPSFTSPSKAPSTTQKKPLSLFDNDDFKPAPKPAANAQDKKAKLLADLFGGSNTTTSSSSTANKADDSETFFLTNKDPPKQKNPPRKTASGFPWDDATPASKTNGSANRESSTLFGGGAALVDDDAATGANKSTMLPRRSRQPSNTLNSKSAVMTVDNMDDDGIEEVIL